MSSIPAPPPQRLGDVPEVHDVRGVKIALLDYTYGLNGFVLPRRPAAIW